MIWEPGVCLKQLNYVRMFEHVADGRLPLQVVQREAGGGGELRHVHHLIIMLVMRMVMVMGMMTLTANS